jgi:dynein heavy chain
VIGVASSDLAANDAALHKLEGFERQDVPALFCYADEAGRFHITLSMPSNFSSLLYLLQEPGKQGGVTVGHLDSGEPLQQLQQLVEGLHLPQVQAAGAAWPEQLQQDWATQSNGFSSALSEAVHARQGHTVLHVPREAGLHDPGAAARQRELVQRLEVQLLRWTQQVRGLLARQRMREQRTGHNEGPMDEVAAWRLRFCHLGSLRDQLQGAGLVAVLKVLEAARSPHLAAFLSLRGSIAKEAEKAASNLRVLAALEEPCAQLAAAQPAQMAQVLPPVLHACRMVWALAPHYDTPQQLTGLLRQVSNAVVARCRSTLDVSGIFSGQGLAGAEQHLEECCCAAAAWQDLFAEAAQSVAAALPQRPWAALDTTAIFAHVDAFVQRCRDLQELCAAQRQFTSGQQLAAVLSGSKAPEIARAIAEVQEGFAQQMVRWAAEAAGRKPAEPQPCFLPVWGGHGQRSTTSHDVVRLSNTCSWGCCRLQGLRYDVLDVACSAWYQDMAGFRSALRDLEQMLGNTLATGVTHASSLTAKLDVVEAFARLATREGLRCCWAVWVGACDCSQTGGAACPPALCRSATSCMCCLLCCRLAGRGWRPACLTGTSCSRLSWRR